jgi:hypothetical protein
VLLLIIAFLVFLILGAAELIIWEHSLLWHSEERRDPRKVLPPR